MAKRKKESKIGLFTKGSSDYIILIVVAMLLALGLIMVLSASSATSLAESGSSYKYFKRQIIAAGVGIIALMFFSKFDYNNFKRFKWLIYFGCFGLLLAVKFVGMSSRRC